MRTRFPQFAVIALGIFIYVGSALAADCDGIVTSPCNDTAYKACVEDIKKTLECGSQDCSFLDSGVKELCACRSIIKDTKSNIIENYEEWKRCQNRPSLPFVKKLLWEDMEKKGRNRKECDGLVTLPCNHVTYSECLHSLELTSGCDRIDCSKAKSAMEAMCACKSLKDSTAQSKEKLCLTAPSPSQVYEMLDKNLKEASAKKVLHCMGYVDAPCNEKGFINCARDLGDFFECDKKECGMPIGVTIYSTCACENLINKEDLAKERGCRHHISPSRFKEMWLEGDKPFPKGSYCDEQLLAPCNESAYKACVQDLEQFLKCDKEECEHMAQTIKPTCACENLVNQADRVKEPRCEFTDSTVDFKEMYAGFRQRKLDEERFGKTH